MKTLISTQAQPNSIDAAKVPRPYLLTLSTHSEEELYKLAQNYINLLAHKNSPDLYDITYDAAVVQEHYPVRAALVADSKIEMIEHLQSFLKGKTDHVTVNTASSGQNVKPVFVFTGMGSQWWAMGQELFEKETAYREFVVKCDTVFRSISGWSILAEMLKNKDESRIRETQIAQPANFVLQAGLSALWNSWGVKPTAIAGHSVGEVTAAYVSGALSLEDALCVIYHRSRVQKKAAGHGKMLALGLPEKDCIAILNQYPREKVLIAAVNSPCSVTLSGDAKTLEEISQVMRTKGVFHRFLRVEMAYHSIIMESVQDELFECLKNIQPKKPVIPVYSTVTGRVVNGVSHCPQYWCDNIRKPVLFARVMKNLIQQGLKVFLEIGPHPVLSKTIKENLLAHQTQGSVIFSLHRKHSERQTMYKALGHLYTLGLEIPWEQFYHETGKEVMI